MKSATTEPGAPEYPRVSTGAAKRSPRIPIAVAAGLAVGVFSGLLVVRATGDGGASEEATARAETQEEGDTGAAVAEAPDAGIEIVATGTDPDAGAAAATAFDAGAVASAEGDGDEDEESDEDEDSDEGEDGDEEDEAETRKVTLRFDVRPARARGVKITVDGERVQGSSHEIAVNGRRRRVRVVARARGFLTWSHRVSVRRDRSVRIVFERPEPSDDGPGGLIDL